MYTARLTCLATMILAVTGCVSNTTPVPPCCYAGAVTTTRLAEVPVRTADGATRRFDEVFTGFTPQEGLFARVLPFNEVERHEINYASLEPLLPVYDANGDGRLEQPEVLVLYAREAARALGTPLRHFGADTPIWAISAPNADIGGLVRWVRANRERMNAEGQAIFRDLERLGVDLLTHGGEGGDEAGTFDFD